MRALLLFNLGCTTATGKLSAAGTSCSTECVSEFIDADGGTTNPDRYCFTEPACITFDHVEGCDSIECGTSTDLDDFVIEDKAARKYCVPNEESFNIYRFYVTNCSTTSVQSDYTTCCKHCGEVSQPCGDTCIELADSCHTSGGCACE